MFTDKQEYYISSNYECNDSINDSINDSSCEDNDIFINYTDDDVFEKLNKDDNFFRSLYNFLEYFDYFFIICLLLIIYYSINYITTQEIF